MFEERSVRSGDAELFVRTVGGGPDSEALVVLHGGPGLSHDYLTGLSALASPDLRVVFYDQRGVGRSTGTVDADLPARQVEDLAAVQAAFGTGRAHLLAHSGGGLTIALTAESRPEAITSAIFIDSAPTTRPVLDDALARLQARIGELTSAGVVTPPGDPSDQTGWIRAALPAYFHDPHHPRARQHGGVTLAGNVYTTLLAALGDYDLTERLSALHVPALVLACPVPFTTTMGLSIADALPDARTVVLPDCGHLPWLEAPERFYPPLHTFLNQAITHTTRVG